MYDIRLVCFVKILIAILLLQQLPAAPAPAKRFRPLKIHLIGTQNGRGLEADQQILKNEIEVLGHQVSCFAIGNDEPVEAQADINIFFQEIDFHHLPHACHNWLIPNPEWYGQSLDALNGIDLILCRTQEVERIFNGLNKKTYLLGFTSRDCYQEEVVKDFSAFAHIAGMSIQKGTLAIVEAWQHNPLFGKATVLQCRTFTPVTNLPNLVWLGSRLQEKELRLLQNHCGIHLCLSETEGFGHYLVEAMSTGAVVLTTDAPPMHEFITDPRCLVPYQRQSVQNLAINYYVDPAALAEKIKHLLQLPADELAGIGRQNRLAYLELTKQFRHNLQRLLNDRRLTHHSQ